MCCKTEEVTTSTSTTSSTAAPVLAARCGEVSFSVETEDRDKVQFPGDNIIGIVCYKVRTSISLGVTYTTYSTKLLNNCDVQGWPGAVTPRA